MKKFILSVAASLIFLPSLYSQTNSISEDSVIIKIMHMMPKGWFIYEKENLLVFEKQDTVWVLEEKQKNSPVTAETKDEKNTRIKKFGKAEKSKITYRYEEKWSNDKIKQAMTANDSIYKEIHQLPKKYNIENLRDKIQSSREVNVYVGKTDKEKQAVSLYEKEKTLLDKKVVQIPSFNTKNFSLTFINAIGCNDGLHIVYPDAISQENYQIRTLFYEFTQYNYNIK
jgi:hypothetical protein